MKAPDDPLSSQIAAARNYAGMNQQELADALGITKSTLSRWEAGTITPPSVRYQRRGLIAELLELTGAPAETFGQPTAARLLTIRRDLDIVIELLRYLADQALDRELESTGEIDRLLDELSSTAQPLGESPPQAEDRSPR